MNINHARSNMIEQQIRPWEVLDTRVLDVIRQIPREQFVPESYKNLAFADIEIPLGQGQLMMSPKLEGRLLQALNINPQDRILEIGTGSGYLTACLAALGGNVVTVDYFSELSQHAGKNLLRHGYSNISFRTGNAAQGWHQDGPFDVIAITGSLPQLHKNFHALLHDHGRLFVITGTEPTMEAHLITRVGENDFRDESIFDTFVKPLETLTPKKEMEF